jgi:DNA primase
MDPSIDTAVLKRDHPIADVIARYGIDLRSTGRALTGRCPFHLDRGRPNLYVYPGSASWYCYRCAMGGDVIRFVERLEGVDFREAVTRILGASTTPGRPTRLATVRK